jgi:hypothetical protein
MVRKWSTVPISLSYIIPLAANLTSCLNFDFAILNLFEPSALYPDGPEVELNWPFPYPILPLAAAAAAGDG